MRGRKSESKVEKWVQRREDTKQQQGAPQFHQGSSSQWWLHSTQSYPDPSSVHPGLARCSSNNRGSNPAGSKISSLSEPWGQILLSQEGSGEPQTLHFLKGGVRFVNSWESENHFLQSTRSGLVPAYTFPRRERQGCLSRLGQLRSCAQGLGKIPLECWLPAFLQGAPSVFLAPQQAAAFVSTTFSPHLLEYAFPSSGINLALEWMQKEHVEASACQIAFKYRLGTHTTGPEEIQDFLFPPLPPFSVSGFASSDHSSLFCMSIS